MQSNGEKFEARPKGHNSKSSQKSQTPGNRRNESSGVNNDFPNHTRGPSNWPRSFLSFPYPPPPLTLVQHPPLNMPANVFNPRVPVFQTRFGMPVPSHPICSTMPILSPMTPILNQSAPTLCYNEWSVVPMCSKPRFAPIPQPPAPKIYSKMHWERKTPHAIAILDPQSKKDIRKEHIESIRKFSSLRQSSEDVAQSTIEAEVKVAVLAIGESSEIQELQFLQESIASNEDDNLKQGELKQIESSEQASANTEPLDQMDETSQKIDDILSDTLSDVTILNEVADDSEMSDEESRMENNDATEDSGDTHKGECDNTVAANEDDLEQNAVSEDNGFVAEDAEGEEEKVCESRIANEELPVDIKNRKYTLEFMYKLNNCQTAGKHIKDLNICPEVIRDIDIKRTVIVNKLLPHYALKGTENVIITTKSKRIQQATNVSKSSPKRCAKSAVKANSGIIHMNLSIHENVRLNEVENAWKPSVLTKQTTDCGEGVETENLLKRFRRILNKITPKNFDALLIEVNELKITTSERLNAVIDLVFEKAVAEPNFKECYTKLCQKVSQMSSAATAKNATQRDLDFRRTLITRVQLEFNTCLMMSKKSPQDFASEADYDVTRKRAIGSVQFVGELFNFKLLSLNTMKDCANKLLTCVTSMSVELICKLITTIGQHMETLEKNSSKCIIQRVKKVAMLKTNNFPRRIRFMVLDLEDLQKTWIMGSNTASSNNKK